MVKIHDIHPFKATSREEVKSVFGTFLCDNRQTVCAFFSVSMKSLRWKSWNRIACQIAGTLAKPTTKNSFTEYVTAQQHFLVGTQKKCFRIMHELLEDQGRDPSCLTELAVVSLHIKPNSAALRNRFAAKCGKCLSWSYKCLGIMYCPIVLSYLSSVYILLPRS